MVTQFPQVELIVPPHNLLAQGYFLPFRSCVFESGWCLNPCPFLTLLPKREGVSFCTGAVKG